MKNSVSLTRIPIPFAEKESLRSVALSSAGDDFYVGLLAGARAKIFDAQTGEAVSFPGMEKTSCFAFRSASELNQSPEVAFAGTDVYQNGICRYDLKTGNRLPSCFLPRSTVCAYSPCGAMLAGASTDGLVKVWTVCGEEAKELVTLRGIKSPVARMSFKGTYDLLFILTRSGQIYIANLMDEYPTPVLCGFDLLNGIEIGTAQDIYCMTTHATAPLAAFAGSPAVIHLVNTETSEVVSLGSKANSIIHHLEFLDASSPESVLSTESTRLLCLGNKGMEIWTFSQHNGPQCALRVGHEKGKILAARMRGLAFQLICQKAATVS